MCRQDLRAPTFGMKLARPRLIRDQLIEGKYPMYPVQITTRQRYRELQYICSIHFAMHGGVPKGGAVTGRTPRQFHRALSVALFVEESRYYPAG